MFSDSYGIWKNEQKAGVILTLSKVFDDATDGGIHLTKITELIGGPGSGKTQFCLQQCINVQIPKILQGLGGAAVYIDTNRGFSLDRIRDMAKAMHDHCHTAIRSQGMSLDLNEFSLDAIMKNIYCIFCNSCADLLTAIVELRTLLRQYSNIRLIVIDSFSYLFRATIPDGSNKLHLLYGVMDDLQDIAEEFQCAVLLTNEITTRVLDDDKKDFIPALGETHLHRTNYQITFARASSDPQLFYARIDKHLSTGSSQVALYISQNGVRPVKRNKL